MTGPRVTTAKQAAETLLEELCEGADSTLRNKGVARLIAANPELRGSMEEACEIFACWIPRLRESLTKFEAAHKFLSHTLRKVKPAVRA